MKIERINHKRLTLYLLLTGLLPLVIVSLWFSIENASIDDVRYRLEEAKAAAEELIKRESDNRLIRKAFSQADHFYIDRSIETITPLKREMDELSRVTSKANHPDIDMYRKRLEQLKSKNRIQFTQISNKSYSNFQETHEALAAPIEVDIEDLKLLLHRIEGAPLVDEEASPSRLHLIITDCSLERKPGASQETYQLQMKLLKREYTQ